MTRTNTPRSARRTVHAAAVGAVALTAAVALPAFAFDRGGDGAVDVVPAAATAETTTTTQDPTIKTQAEIDASLAYLSTLTPEQQFAAEWSTWTPQRQADFAQLAEVAQRQADFYAMVAWFDAVAAQEAAEAQAAAAQQAAAARASARSSSGSSVSGSVWDRLAQCETGGNWSHPTVSGGFSGGLMFHYATWNANGGQAYAATASGATREQQIIVAERILAASGWGAWPGCSIKLGLR